jgi:hypothetical protein
MGTSMRAPTAAGLLLLLLIDLAWSVHDAAPIATMSARWPEEAGAAISVSTELTTELASPVQMLPVAHVVERPRKDKVVQMNEIRYSCSIGIRS